MTRTDIMAFALHVVKSMQTRKPVTFPAMSGRELDMFLRACEAIHGYA